MKRQLWITTLAVGFASLALCLQAQAGFITSVTKADGNDACSADLGCPNLDVVPLEAAPALAPNDRTHTLIDIPAELLDDDKDAQMVQLSNSDKDSGSLTQSVTIGQLSILYVGIDNRQFGGAGGTNIQPMEYSWMDDTAFTGLPAGFESTGRVVGVDENNNGEANQYFTLFASLAPPGTYTLGAHEGGGNNMYVVLADDHLLSIPEPSTMILGLTSLLGLGLVRRRK